MKIRPVVAALAALALAVAPATSAFADDISNNLDGTVDAAAEQMNLTVGGQSGATVLRVIPEGDDGKNGCNLTGSTTLVASVTSSSPAVATVSPGSVTFDSCGAIRNLTVTPVSIGATTISLGQTSNNSGGTFNLAPATFTVTVAPPANTRPKVTVVGVDADYEFGESVGAICAIQDTEDGNKTLPATISPLSGPRAADGLGAATASCSYTDEGGLSASDSVTFHVVDTTAPTVTVPDEDIPVEATGKLTEVAFTVSATDAVDGQVPVTCTDTDDTAWVSGDQFPLGTRSLTCSATDQEGNTSTADPFDVVVTDTTGPDLHLPANLVVGNDSYTVDYGPATATDAVDGDVPVTCAPAAESTFALGETTVDCEATDAAGHTSTGSFTVTVQDTTVPVVTVPGALAVPATGPDGAEVPFEVSANDDVDGPLEVTCDPASGSTFPLGTTVVTCTATDKAGNTGSNSFEVTVADTTPPTITVPDDLTQEATTGAGAEVTFDTTASDAVDGNVPVTCDPASGSTFPLGTRVVTCTATDRAGNVGTASFDVTVEDTTAPELTVPGDMPGIEATGPNGATVNYDPSTATDAVDAEPTVVCQPESGSVFKLGETEVACTATDDAGNSATGSFVVEVVDTTPPALTVPANFAVGNTSATGADNVSYPAPTAEDVVDGTVDVTCTPPSGTFFPLGTTTVTCTASDQAGNEATDEFTVEVQDRTAPVVTVPQDITAEATGPTGAPVTFEASANDDVSGVLTPTCVPPSGSTFELGNTAVTCSATDAAGNIGDSRFTVSVVDTTPPALTVAGDRTATATSAAGARVSFDDPTAVDLVDGTVAASCDRASGSLFPLGTTTVTCSAQDSRDNITKKSFVVTVTVPWSGILPPVNPDGSSVFRQGSTVPVKFRLAGTAATIGNLTARLWYTRTGAVNGTPLEPVSTSNATTGNLFRFDDGQYIFNLGTKNMSPGSYTLRIDLGDGVLHTVVIGLR